MEMTGAGQPLRADFKKCTEFLETSKQMVAQFDTLLSITFGNLMISMPKVLHGKFSYHKHLG